MFLKVIMGLIAVVLTASATAIFGLLIGAYIGGNYFPNFSFLGLTGYEAVGLFGLILGAILGMLTPIFLFGSKFVKWLDEA